MSRGCSILTAGPLLITGTQSSSAAYRLRDLQGDLTSLGPGFPLSLLPLRAPEGEADEQQSACLSLPFLPAPPSSAFPLICFSLGLGPAGRAECGNTVSAR